MKRLLLFAMLVLLLACSADSSHENLGQVASALDGANGLPVPVVAGTTTPAWPDGAPLVDLYVADAWAECSFMSAELNALEQPDLNVVDTAVSVLRANPRPAATSDGYHDAYLDGCRSSPAA
jgi:hypothetical protein